MAINNKKLAELMGPLDANATTEQELVIAAFDQLFDRQPNPEGMNYWVERLETDLDVADLQEAILNGVRQYDGEFSSQAIADLSLMSSRRTVAQAIEDAGIEAQEAATILAGVTDTASRDAALADIEAMDTGDDDGDDDDQTPSDEAQTVYLDTKANNVQTADGNDEIYAYVQQNAAGEGNIANAIATGDVIDGKGGYDVLDATMIDDVVSDAGDMDPMPTIKNVEEIRIQALEDVVLDADRVENEEHYASDRSRDDLVVTNVNIAADQITSDIKIEMKDTQQDSDMAVYFDESSLKAAPDEVAQSAEFFIQVADGNASDVTKPLDNIEFDLAFTQGDDTYTFTNLSAIDGTYSGLRSAVDAALAEQGLSNYTVELGNEFNSFTTESGQTFNLDYTGQFVTVTDDEGQAFDDINFTPRQKSGSELAIILAQSDIEADEVRITNDVEANIILDNVGRGSNGGELVVGSTSNSGTSTGIEVFNIEVRESSVIHDISTTNDDNDSWDGFQEINLTNGTDYAGDFVLTNTDGDDVDEYNNVDSTGFKEGLDNITAKNFDGNIVLGRDADIVNLGTLSANVAGDVTLNATYNGDTLASDNQAFVVVTGSGNDEITADVTGNSTSGSTDTSLTVNAGNGNNEVTLSSDATEVTVAEVTTGTGTDTVTGGETHLEVNTGSANDVIYAENTGVKGTAALAAGSDFDASAHNAVNTDGDTYALDHVELLHDREIQITVAMPEDAASIPAAAFTDGFELTTTVKASEGVLTTERDLYNAVADAINADDVVNKLVEASVDSNGTLSIEYLIDGLTAAGNEMVEIAVIENDYDDLSTTAKDALQDAIEEKFSDSDITAASIETAYDAADAISDTVDGIANGAAGVFTIDLDGLTATGGANGTLDFTIDGSTTTLVEGTDFTGDANATALATSLDATDLNIGGIEYTIADEGAGVISLTQTTPTAVSGGISIESSEGGAATVTGAQSTVAVVNEGTDATTTGVNEVNGGNGDDVIVLSSNDATKDTLVMDGTNFGNDTIVHFNDAAGGDILDFSNWLTNVDADGASTSTVSEVRIDGTLTDIDAMTENSVSIIDFADIVDNDSAAAGGLNFDTLTTTQLVNEMNAAGDFAASATSGDLVGTELKSIVMIEDDANADLADDNEGFYKVYAVTYDTDAAVDEFTEATLIGTLDFGDVLDVASMGDTNIA